MKSILRSKYVLVFFPLEKTLGYLCNDKFYRNVDIRHLKKFTRVELAVGMVMS